jgi:hypothetical protein
MGIATAIAVGATVSAVGGAVAANQAKQAAKGARGERNRAQLQIENLKKKRPKPINPYSDTRDLSEMAQDLSGQMTNAFSNLGVATKSAEIQMEQSDIALANTLDTIRATGASAGGATALAQAALQSKNSVAASIEQQEAQNEKLRAQGEQQLQQQKLSEQQRLQSIAISEGQRVQAAQAAGKQFEFQTEENRINADLDRASGQERQASANVASANQAKASAISGAFGGVTSMIGSAAGGGAFKKASDKRTKKNIKLIGKSNSGLNIYAFEYINKAFGKGVWQGVMADEVPSNAVIKNFAGNFDGVDYSKIDVEFKQLSL